MTPVQVARSSFFQEVLRDVEKLHGVAVQLKDLEGKVVEAPAGHEHPAADEMTSPGRATRRRIAKKTRCVSAPFAVDDVGETGDEVVKVEGENTCLPTVLVNLPLGGDFDFQSLGSGPHTYRAVAENVDANVGFDVVPVEYLLSEDGDFILHLDADRPMGHAILVQLKDSLAVVTDPRLTKKRKLSAEVLFNMVHALLPQQYRGESQRTGPLGVANLGTSSRFEVEPRILRSVPSRTSAHPAASVSNLRAALVFSLGPRPHPTTCVANHPGTQSSRCAPVLGWLRAKHQS